MRTWRAAVGTALVVALFAAAVQPTAGSGGSAAAVDNFTVGALLDLKHGWTSLGRASRVTLQLAAADANARLAKDGSTMRVRLRIVDVHGDPQASARALRRLAAAGVRVVIGPQASSEVGALRATARPLGVVVISQGSTAHSLAVRGDNVFRFVPDDIRESEAVVALLKRDGIDAVVPVWRNDSGNAGLAKAVRERVTRGGGSATKGVRYGTKVSDFAATLDQVRAQVDALRTAGASRIAVYLAAFDEAADLFDEASGDDRLGSLRWYGSDGAALTPRLTSDPKAAAFAAGVGYPNPILGLDDSAASKAKKLVARIQARLGHRPDAFALTAYDALQVAVDARVRAGGAASDAQRLARALARVAHGYVGVTGKLLLNAAGDRAYGSYDFWSVCTGAGSASWKRTWSYVATAPEHGKIIAREHC